MKLVSGVQSRDSVLHVPLYAVYILTSATRPHKFWVIVNSMSDSFTKWGYLNMSSLEILSILYEQMPSEASSIAV